MRVRSQLLVVVIVATATVAAARPGRSVRVPRPVAALSTNARFCALHEDDRGLCFSPVAVGDRGAVLTQDGENLGETEVVEVTVNNNRCGQPETWSIRINRGQLGGRYFDYGATLLVGVAVATTGKLSPANMQVPGDNPLASIMYSVDTDGDDRADLLVDQFACDDGRRPTRSNYPTHMCTEYWLGIRDRWQRARIDQVAICNR